MAATSDCLGCFVTLTAVLDAPSSIDRDREAVGLVDYGEVPLLVCLVEGLSSPLGTEEVAADDDAVELIPWVLRDARVKVHGAELDKVELEPLGELTDPLGTKVG